MRDALTAELADLYADILFRRHGIVTSQSKEAAREIVDHLHPVIETAEELDALPVGSVVLTSGGLGGEHDFAWVKGHDDDYPWKGTYGNVVRSADMRVIFGPITVLHVGGDHA